MVAHHTTCRCLLCELARAEELAGRGSAFEEGDVAPPRRPRPGTAKALAMVGRGTDKRRQALRGLKKGRTT